MFTVQITIEAASLDDIRIAAEEAVRAAEQGYTSGGCDNETSGYEFTVEGEAGPMPGYEDEENEEEDDETGSDD